MLLRYQSFTNEYIEDIQIFGMNMPFISSREARKCIFHEWRHLFHLVKRKMHIS